MGDENYQNYDEKFEEIFKIRRILEKYHNPVYFFDNDTDGLCSFLILRKFCEKGKGVAIKSFPELSPSYSRKISELKADSVFILDKPVVASGFIEHLTKMNIMSIWIDHHKGNKGFQKDEENKDEKEKNENFIFFNPTEKYGINKPVSYWSYLIAENRKLQWLSAIGCIGDWFVPPFIFEIYNEYSDLFEIKKSEVEEKAEKIIYETSFGKIVNIFNFALKDTTTNISKMIKFLIGVNTPYEILEKNEKNKSMHKRFECINKKYQKLLEKARTKMKDDFLFFKYSGDLSISAELSNTLLYENPDKLIVVAYQKGEKARISIRSNYCIREIVLEALRGLDASGGGHEKAMGANVKIDDFLKFEKRLLELWQNLKMELKMERKEKSEKEKK